jgi:hypothetical protein
MDRANHKVLQGKEVVALKGERDLSMKKIEMDGKKKNHNFEKKSGHAKYDKNCEKNFGDFNFCFNFYFYFNLNLNVYNISG